MELDYFSIEKRISKWKNYFTLRYSPEKITDPEIAAKAVRLLKMIKQRIDLEYVFLDVQQSSSGSFCRPEHRTYNPSNTVNTILGRYDILFFQELEKRLTP